MGRFAKGPSETGGFNYPRRRVVPSSPKPILAEIGLESAKVSPALVPIVATQALEVVQTPLVEVAAPEQPAPVKAETVSPIPTIVEPVETSEETEPQAVEDSKPEQTAEQQEQQESDAITILLPESPAESVDDTVGPGESHLSESDVHEEEDEEESESEEEEVVKPTPASPVRAAPIPPPITKSVKQTSSPKPKATKPLSPVLKKVTLTPINPTPNMIAPVPSPPPARSLLSKIKAYSPYSTHMLAIVLLCVTGVLLCMLYEFGADLASDLDLPTQLIRFTKLAVLFGVVAVCVNFIEDNKELSTASHPSLETHLPRLRPNKMSKNKRKMMMMASAAKEE